MKERREKRQREQQDQREREINSHRQRHSIRPMSDLDMLMGDDDDLAFEEDPPDLKLSDNQIQITDAEADGHPHGSAHRAVAYLEEQTYPPHGSSAGRAGGSMRPIERLEIFGAFYDHGLDILGAAKAPVVRKAPPRGGFVQKTTARGRKFTGFVPLKPKHGNHKQSIANARTAGKRAVALGKKIAAMKLKAPAKAPTAVHGAPAISRATMYQASKLQKLKTMGGALVKQGSKVLANADKHEKLIKAKDQRTKAGAKAVQAMTHLRGYDEMVGYDDVVAGATAELLHDLASATGLLHDISDVDEIDMVVLGQVTQGPMDDSGDMGEQAPVDSGAAGYGSVPGPPDYGLGAPPTVAPPLEAGVDYNPDPGPNDYNFYSSNPDVPGVPLPVGYIVYDGTIKPSYMSLGSYTTFFKQIPGSPAPDGGPGSGYQWHDDGWYSFRSGDYPGPAGSGDLRLKKAESSGLSTGIARSNNSKGYNWGPLIGNPGMAITYTGEATADYTPPDWTKGLRYDAGANQWFWYYNSAPAWARAADDQARLNQAILDYQAALISAKTDYVNQQLADALDAETAKQTSKQQVLDDAAHQFQIEQDAKQDAADQARQAALDAAAQAQQAAEDESYARRTQAEAEAAAMIEERAAQAQAEVDRQELELLMRLEAAQAAEDAGGGADYRSTGGPVEGDADATNAGSYGVDTADQVEAEEEPGPEAFTGEEDYLAGISSRMPGPSVLGEDAELLTGYDDEMPFGRHSRRDRYTE